MKYITVTKGKGKARNRLRVPDWALSYFEKLGFAVEAKEPSEKPEKKDKRRTRGANREQ